MGCAPGELGGVENESLFSFVNLFQSNCHMFVCNFPNAPAQSSERPTTHLTGFIPRVLCGEYLALIRDIEHVCTLAAPGSDFTVFTTGIVW